MSSASEATILRSTASALVLLLVAGCASTHEEGIVADAPLKEDEGIVFGILNTSSYDSKGNKRSMDASPAITYSITFGTSSSGLGQAFDSNPYSDMFGPNRVLKGATTYPEALFARRLPAGEYYVYELYRSVGNVSGRSYPNARFTVTPNKATYIGSLQLEFLSTTGLLGEERSGVQVALKVTNEFEKAQKQYKERNPRLPYEMTTKLMTVGN